MIPRGEGGSIIHVATLTGPFVNEAAARGIVPPLRAPDRDVRAWPLFERDGDLLILDQFGDLWWARAIRRFEVRIIRRCWPEEFARARADIERAIIALTGDDARA